MLQHHRGQMVGGVTRNIIEADAVTQGQEMSERLWAATKCLLSCQRALTRTERWARTGGKATHLSSLSTPFSLMQLAMMMMEAKPSLLPERLIFSAGFVPLSSSI
jgi:hypothetical protein